MTANPAIEALLNAFSASGDARLLGAALGLAGHDADRRSIVAAALAAPADGLDTDTRRPLAQAALDMGDALDAISLCGEDNALLALRVDALLVAERAAEAEAAYLAAVAADPVLEDPDIAARLKQALAATPMAASNVIGFADAARGLRGHERSDREEAAAARALYSEKVSAISFADVGGLDDVKKQIIRRIVTPFRKPSLFAKYRRKAGGGVLLFGPPGCGKTLLARATAGECEARFVNVSVVDVVDKYIGEAERKLSAIFADARRDTPTVLFFDELEALAGSRSNHASQSHVSLVSTFLTEMDGFANNNDGVLILAATNMPWGVDAAFRRPGRFDRVQFVPPPDRAARAEILRLHLAARPLADDCDADAIAAKTAGYSGADLENLVNTAVDVAIEETLSSGVEAPVAQRHLLDALQEVRPTTLEWLTTARNYAKYSNNGGQYDDVAAFLKANGL
ncbi:AAA family ATPase [Altererythrobacter xixiisoli]|uniref:AAA family ATPase n=1 Tax=Croceibacterium xixiisoli TaxID=1476466 RepID=A0A6I4TQ81_9SPHN|nr:ATP-binding protein [Croceibacterium xixiisoli]MXO98295.1 AAA family ATPase [Croceibacterium xixiisoli]